MTYDVFANTVLASGLQPRFCSEVHWQIRGGKHVVNFYPHTKRGERFYVDHAERGTGGTLERAMRAAKGEIQFPMKAQAPRIDAEMMRRWRQHRGDGGKLSFEHFVESKRKHNPRQSTVATRREIAMRVLDDLPDGAFFAAAEEMFGLDAEDFIDD